MSASQHVKIDMNPPIYDTESKKWVAFFTIRLGGIEFSFAVNVDDLPSESDQDRISRIKDVFHEAMDAMNNAAQAY